MEHSSILKDKEQLVGLTIERVRGEGDELIFTFTNGAHAIFKAEKEPFEGDIEIYQIYDASPVEWCSYGMPEEIWKFELDKEEVARRQQQERAEKRLYLKLKRKYDPYKETKG